MDSFIQTVRGAVPAESITFTLPHEHTVCSLWHIPNRWDYWELTDDEEIIAPELAAYRDRGGTCLVDLSLPGMGRDPLRLRRLSERSGLHLVMGTGWYRQAYYPVETLIDRRTVGDLAETMIRETRDGVDGTGIRAGIIGEIGTDKPWVSAQEERVFRAAGLAQRETGLAVTTHAVMSPVGLAQLAILEDAGADPTRVIIGHADSYPNLAYHLAIIERGALVEFDFLGMRSTPMEEHGEPHVIELLLRLLELGHADRVLLSQDVCSNAQLATYAGSGYTYLQDTFLPRLRAAGVGQAEIDRITIENPRRLLAIG